MRENSEQAFLKKVRVTQNLHAPTNCCRQSIALFVKQLPDEKIPPPLHLKITLPTQVQPRSTQANE